MTWGPDQFLGAGLILFGVMFATVLIVHRVLHRRHMKRIDDQFRQLEADFAAQRELR